MSVEVHVLFFARLREAIGRDRDVVTVDVDHATVADLLQTLRTRGPQWQNALSEKFLVAVNHEVVQLDSPLRSGDEVAFYPPVTGG